MSARVYLMKRVKDCKDVSIMSPQDEQRRPKRIEYILEGNLENLSVWIFSVPFSLKGSLKWTNHVNVHKLYAVH